MRITKIWLAIGLILSMLTMPVGAKELINMEFKQAPLVDVFQILGQLGGYNVLVDPTVNGDVSFTLKNLAVTEALDLVTRTTGYRYQLVGNTLVVGSAERLKSEFGSEDFSFVSVKHVDAKAAQSLVALVTPQVKTYLDEEQNLVVLYGLTSDLELAKRVLQQYDQKTYVSQDINEPMTATVVEGSKKTAPVYYADGVALLEQVRQNWPALEFAWDELSQTIQGQTSEAEWAQIKAFVEERDLPAFALKGILGTLDQSLALVEYKGVTSLLKLGDELNNWQVVVINDGKVEFAQGQRKFTIRIGR